MFVLVNDIGKRGDGKTAKQETSEKPIKKQVRSYASILFIISFGLVNYPKDVIL